MAIYLGSGSLTYLLSLIKQKLDLKVDKDGNKILSTNDYTNDDKNKLSNIPANAQANIVETIVVNNNPLTPDDNKAVNITIPTSTQDIENDSGYITGSAIPTAVSAFTNDSGYITSNALMDYATEEYVDNAVAGVSGGGSVDLSSYLTKTEATNTYATKSDTYTIEESKQAAEDAVKIKSIKVYDTALSPTNKVVTIPQAATSIYGCVRTTSTVKNTSDLIAVPIINGIPYYKDTTYSVATTSANGLMASTDKTNLNNLVNNTPGYITTSAISTHNTASDAHSDIRNTIPTLTEISDSDVVSIWDSTT